MASSKLSALTALTSVGNDDLVYVADTADGGTTYASKKVTKANLFSGYATESYVTSAISDVIGGAPECPRYIERAGSGHERRRLVLHDHHQPDQCQRDPCR